MIIRRAIVVATTLVLLVVSVYVAFAIDYRTTRDSIAREATPILLRETINGRRVLDIPHANVIVDIERIQSSADPVTGEIAAVVPSIVFVNDGTSSTVLGPLPDRTFVVRAGDRCRRDGDSPYVVCV